LWKFMLPFQDIKAASWYQISRTEVINSLLFSSRTAKISLHLWSAPSVEKMQLARSSKWRGRTEKLSFFETRARAERKLRSSNSIKFETSTLQFHFPGNFTINIELGIGFYSEQCIRIIRSMGFQNIRIGFIFYFNSLRVS
jgi:hypothetical protein